jgi:hypothetical protein
MTNPSEAPLPPAAEAAATVGTYSPPKPGTPREPDLRTAQPPSPDELVSTWVMWLLTLLFALIVVAAIDILFSIWPTDAPQQAGSASVPIFWGSLAVTLSHNDRMMLIAILMGVIGAMVHAMTSFADFVGNRRLARNWLPWYFLRPLIGSGLSLFFYVGFRAGLLTTATAQGDINPFGIAAIGGLAGMFSKQATDKLNEVFTTMFKTSTAGDANRGGKLGPNAPTKPTGAPAP